MARDGPWMAADCGVRAACSVRRAGGRPAGPLCMGVGVDQLAKRHGGVTKYVDSGCLFYDQGWLCLTRGRH